MRHADFTSINRASSLRMDNTLPLHSNAIGSPSGALKSALIYWPFVRPISVNLDAKGEAVMEVISTSSCSAIVSSVFDMPKFTKLLTKIRYHFYGIFNHSKLRSTKRAVFRVRCSRMTSFPLVISSIVCWS